MQLVKLYSSNQKFKVVNFKSGINIIYAESSGNNKNDLAKTYNGTGKSLLVEIIHFCLGSKKIKSFEQALPNETFYLEFLDCEGEVHSISRNCSKQNDLYLDGKKYNLTGFKEEMTKYVFFDEMSTSKISFRTIISRYIRRSKKDYLNFLNFVHKEDEAISLLNTLFLLGVDYSIIENKIELKNEFKIIKEHSKSYKNDVVIKNYFTNNEDLTLKKLEIEGQLNALSEDIKNFRVSENFEEMRRRYSELISDLDSFEKEKQIATATKNKYEGLLRKNIEINLEPVTALYNELNELTPDIVKKTINEAIDFQNSLISQRNKKINNEVKLLVNKIENLNKKIENISIELNQLDKNLKIYGDAKDLLILEKREIELTQKLEKINAYLSFDSKYKEELAINKAKTAQSLVNTINYISNIFWETLKTEKQKFSRIVKSVAPSKKSLFDIVPDENDNKKAFNIIAKITDDSSDGVKDLLIFCFDLMLFELKKTRVDFIVHDSRLFSEMDPRTRLLCFNYLNDNYSKLNDRQYIFSINEESVMAIKDFDKKNFTDDFILKNRICLLKDDKPENKLLGRQIEIDYDK